MPIVKNCVICDSVFSVKAHRAETAKTCSSKCKGELQAKRYAATRKSKPCKKCGTLFSVPPYRAASVHFCSASCKREANTAEINCLQCGSQFSCYKSQLKKQRKYCSKACHVKAQMGGAEVATLICEQCNKAYTKTPSAVAGSRYCSAGCLYDAKRNPVDKQCDCCGKSFVVNGARAESARFCSEACKWKHYTGDEGWQSPDGLNREGYKRAANSYEHREVMLNWMLEDAPDHPFIVDVDGDKRLDPGVDVHHIDRNRTNNARSNLLAIIREAHSRMHHKRKRPKATECWPPNPQKY